MHISQTFATEPFDMSPAEHPCISAESEAGIITDLALPLARLADAQINIATSDYLNRPLRSQRQAWMEYHHRKAA